MNWKDAAKKLVNISLEQLPDDQPPFIGFSRLAIAIAKCGVSLFDDDHDQPFKTQTEDRFSEICKTIALDEIAPNLSATYWFIGIYCLIRHLEENAKEESFQNN